jgi:hypothetical protein
MRRLQHRRHGRMSCRTGSASSRALAYPIESGKVRSAESQRLWSGICSQLWSELPRVVSPHCRGTCVWRACRHGWAESEMTLTPVFTAALGEVEQEVTDGSCSGLSGIDVPIDAARRRRGTDHQEGPMGAKEDGFCRRNYYDSSGHDTRLLYLLSRHIPNRLTGISAARLGIGRSISGNGVNSLWPAYTPLTLDAYSRTATTTVKFGISQSTGMVA